MRKALSKLGKNKPLKVVAGTISFVFNLALLILGASFMIISAGSVGPGDVELVIEGIGRVGGVNGHGVVFFFGFLMAVAPVTVGMKSLTEVLLYEKDKDKQPIRGIPKIAWHTIQHFAPFL